MKLNTHPSCDEVRAALPLHVGDDLDAPDAQAVERHLAGCGACREAMARGREARAAFAGLQAELGPPPELWTDLRERLRQEGLVRPVEAPAPARPVPVLRRWTPVAAAAAALLLVGGLFLLAERPGGAPEPGREPRVAEELPPPAPAPGAEDPRALPESLQPGASRLQPVALQKLAPEDWPQAAPVQLQPSGGRPGADGVMAGLPARFQ